MFDGSEDGELSGYTSNGKGVSRIISPTAVVTPSADQPLTTEARSYTQRGLPRPQPNQKRD